MRNIFFVILLVLLHAFVFCNNTKKSDTANNSPADAEQMATTADQVLTTDWRSLTKDYITWYNYTYYNIQLSQDFIGLDTNLEPLDKKTFIEKLRDEDVVAFKTRISQGEPTYQLFTLNSNDEGIKETNKQMASTALEFLRMEGKEMPSFNFTDVRGKVYSSASTKGKIILIKCWFIRCVACVKEFPELNKLVEANKGKDNMLFVSLAMDSAKDLEKFLRTKEFKYAVVPDATDYMNNILHITSYPTHLLIDANGKIVKIVNRIEELMPFLHKMGIQSI